MSLSAYFEKLQGFKVIPISRRALETLSFVVKEHSFVDEHTHVVVTDASINSGCCGIGIVLYDVAKDSVEIAAVQRMGTYSSVESELCAIEKMVEFLPSGSHPLFQFDQKYVINYWRRRRRSNPTGGVDQEYIDTARKIEDKFAKFTAWWSASKEGEVLHSIADALASHASSGRTRNHQTGRLMSLEKWTYDYDFARSAAEYDTFLANNEAYTFAKKRTKERRRRNRGRS